MTSETTPQTKHIPVNTVPGTNPQENTISAPAQPRNEQPAEQKTGINLADFAGTPYSETHSKPVEELQLTDADKKQEEIKIAAVKTAEQIYKKGEALQYLENSCQELHVGDTLIIKALLLSYAATRVSNNEIGININISGDAGSGKSHVSDTVAKHIPQSHLLSGRYSDKALFYIQMRPGTIIYADDQYMTETQAEIMKAQTSDINKEFIYHSVRDGKLEQLRIPPRCIRWFVRCELSGDEQTADRELSFYTDNSAEHQKKVKELKDRQAANPTLLYNPAKIETCRAIWNLLPPTDANTPESYVVIPFADRIHVSEGERLRNYALFHALIRASAILSAPVREKNETGSVIASIDDFRTAASIMNPILAGDSGNQRIKLSQNENKILEWLKTQKSGIYTFREMRSLLMMTESAFYRAVSGRKDRGTTGLRGKVPGIDVGILGEENGALFHNEKSLQWNREEYFTWGGSKMYFTLD